MTEDAPKGPPPVDPMSDVAWARVERGLMTRLDSPTLDAPPRPSRRRWLWLGVPALAAAAVAAVLVLARHDEPSGTADPLATIEPSRVVAGDAASSITFGDAHVALDAHSAIVMTYEAQSPSVLLERGAAAFTVAPRNGRAPFVVRAGDTVVRVVGTQFRVSRSDEQVGVAVDHGIVDVQFRGNTVRVGANQTWSSESPGEVSQVAMATPAPLRPATTAPITEPVADKPVADEPGADEPGADKPGADKLVADKPVADKPGADKPGADKPGAGKPVAGKPGADKPGADKPTADPCAVDPECTKYYRLLALEQQDPAATLAGYLELSKGSSKWAAVGLYAAGRLAADRRDRRAVTFLTIYLRRFPSGANAGDARTLLQRVQGDNK